MFQQILVSTDGSDLAQKGVDQGLALAKSLGAKVTILTVTERFPVYAGIDGALAAGAYDAMADSQRTAAGRVLVSAREAAERMGVEADTALIENATPADAIVLTAKARNCGLIVMASHGRRGIGRLMLGSVTAEVVGQSTVPVLVVR